MDKEMNEGAKKRAIRLIDGLVTLTEAAALECGDKVLLAVRAELQNFRKCVAHHSVIDDAHRTYVTVILLTLEAVCLGAGLDRAPFTVQLLRTFLLLELGVGASDNVKAVIAEDESSFHECENLVERSLVVLEKFSGRLSAYKAN